MNFKLYDGRCTKPAESGKYLCFITYEDKYEENSGYWSELNYSAKHGLWNCADCYTDKEAKEHSGVFNNGQILAWCIPERRYDVIDEEVF